MSIKINWMNLGLGAAVGYLGASLLSPRGYSMLSPGNDEIGAALMIGGGGPLPHTPGGQIGGVGSRGSQGGPSHQPPWLRAYGGPSVQWPNEFGPEQSKCTPEDLDCGTSFTCLFHKTMCALGLWK